MLNQNIYCEEVNCTNPSPSVRVPWLKREEEQKAELTAML